MDKREYRTGALYVLLCQLMWGFLPIYWQALEPIESWKIVLYRILTMFIYSYIVARFAYSKEEIWGLMADKKKVLRSFAAGLVLTFNWSLYIWAMNSGRVIQASIGYFIEPIVICAFGIVLFKEKLTKYNIVAMCLALIAIVIILVHFGQLPGVALGLAVSWAVYSAIKKASDQPPLIALVYETMPYAVLALIAIVYIEARGVGAISVNAPRQYAMLWASGLMTLIPVALFGYAAKKTPLQLLGLAQYVSPTISLLLGIFLFREPTDRVQMMALGIIWIGLVFFTYGEFERMKELPNTGSDDNSQ